jgi:putative SOS response-associated peptidase YedK
MCFSYAINFSASALQSKLQLGDEAQLDIQLPWETPTKAMDAEAPLLEPGYYLSGFDRPLLPVITLPNTIGKDRENGLVPNDLSSEKPSLAYLLSAMRWGLIPHWCKTPEQAQELSLYGLNARAETLQEKPLFRDAWKTQPCLIPVSGFFESQTIGKKKQPHYIYAADHQPLLFAGLFAQWTDTQTGELLQSYSIITTDANDLMAEIHNVKKRMPVILSNPQAKAFLLGDAAARETLLKPCDNDVLKAHPVANWLNQMKVNRNVPQALLPVEKDFPQTLF